MNRPTKKPIEMCLLARCQLHQLACRLSQLACQLPTGFEVVIGLIHIYNKELHRVVQLAEFQLAKRPANWKKYLYINVLEQLAVGR